MKKTHAAQKVPRGKKRIESEKYKSLILKRKILCSEAIFDLLQKKINTKLVQSGKKHLKLVDVSKADTA